MSDGNGYATFSGSGFGTLQRPTANGGNRDTPKVISARATLRGSMPAIYHESDFAMRFVGALETVLDPIAGVLDALPEHFSPDYAPPAILDVLASWLSVESDEAQELSSRRELVRMAAELGRRRGTVAGLELALRLNFPDVPMRVEDEGGVHWSLDAKPVAAEPARFVVYVDVPVQEERQAAIARCIEHQKPVSATYKLRIRTAKAKPKPKPKAGGDGGD